MVVARGTKTMTGALSTEDAAWLDAAFAHHYDSLCQLAVLMLGDPEAAENIFMDALVAASVRSSTVENVGSYLKSAVTRPDESRSTASCQPNGPRTRTTSLRRTASLSTPSNDVVSPRPATSSSMRSVNATPS